MSTLLLRSGDAMLKPEEKVKKKLFVQESGVEWVDM
jgi:hypothetical protein